MFNFSLKTPEISNFDTKDDFESQLSNAKKIGDLDIIEIEAKKPKSNTPVLFAPGWGRKINDTKEALRVLHNLDRSLITVDHARIGGEMAKSEKKYPKVELIKAESLLKSISITSENGDKEKPVDVIAQSEGCINTIIAASLKPERFRNIVLVCPAGLIGEDTFFELKKRFDYEKKLERHGNIKDGGKREKDSDHKKNADFMKYAAKNPVRTVMEVQAIAKTQIYELLRELKEKGIGISIIAGVDDEAFPMDRMQKIMSKHLVDDGEFIPDGFVSVKEGHNKIYNTPEKYMAAAEGLLTAMEKKYQKKDVGS